MATHYTLKLDRGQLDRIALAEAKREATDTGRRVLNRANVHTPVRTGRLRGGNHMRVHTKGLLVIAEIFNETEYAASVHDGSKAYTIRPKHKKALKFTIGTETVFATRVRMPARRGRPWLLRALKEVAVPAGYRLVR